MIDRRKGLRERRVPRLENYIQEGSVFINSDNGGRRRDHATREKFSTIFTEAYESCTYPESIGIPRQGWSVGVSDGIHAALRIALRREPKK